MKNTTQALILVFILIGSLFLFNTVSIVFAAMSYSNMIASSGSGNGQVSGPRNLFVDSSGNIYVAEANNKRVQKFDSSGSYVLKFGDASVFSSPWGIVVDSSGNIYVSDTINNNVKKFDSTGSLIWT